MIMLPDHPLFSVILAMPPPDWHKKQETFGVPINFVKDSETGIFRSATPEELEDYLLGGEYFEVFEEDEEEE